MRQKFRRRVRYRFNDTYFKPRGIPLSDLSEVEITNEELETLRLRNIEKIDQQQASKMMGISQSQYQRDLTTVLEKITKAFMQGSAINIKKRE